MTETYFHVVGEGVPVEPNHLLRHQWMMSPGVVELWQLAELVLDLEPREFALFALIDRLMGNRFANYVKPVLPTFTVMLREVVFEQLRQGYYSSLPSRNGAVFLCETVDDAIGFNTRFRGGAGTIWECAVDSGAVFLADMNFINVPEVIRRGGEDPRTTLTTMAHSYWQGRRWLGQGADQPIREVLVNPGDVRLLQPVPQP